MSRSVASMQNSAHCSKLPSSNAARAADSRGSGAIESYSTARAAYSLEACHCPSNAKMSAIGRARSGALPC